MSWVGLLLRLFLYTVVAFAAAALSLYIYGCRPLYRWRFRKIPGPPGRWLYGDWLESFAWGNHIFQQEMVKKYGPIFRCWGLTGPEICVSSPALVRTVLLSNLNRTPFPSLTPRTKENKDFVDSHILTAKDSKWRSLREAWAPFFYSGSLEQFAERMNYSAQLLCQRLDAVADSSTGETIDMYPLLADLTMDVIARVSFGVELNTQQPLNKLDADGLRAKQLREDAAYSFQSFGGVNSKWFYWTLLFPEATWFIKLLAIRYPDPNYQKMLDGQKRILATVAELIQQHRDQLAADGYELKAHDSATSQQLANGYAKTNGLEMGSKEQPPASSFESYDLDSAQKAGNGPRSYPSGLSAKGSGVKGYNSGLATPRSASQTPRTPRTPGGIGSKPSDLAKEVLGSKKSRKGVQPGSFLDLLVRGFDRDTGKPFSDGTITRQGHAMLLAGFETTASTLAFSTYNLARYPEKAAKLYEEISQQPDEPTLDSLEQMPYTEACLKESLRLYPSAAVGSRECQQDCILGGYHVRKGTYLKCSFWTLQRDPALWHDAEEYIPERWVEGTPEAAKRPQYAWDGFGDGPRACPGGKLAFEEAKIAMIAMFKKFEFRLAPGQVPIKIRHNMTMSPAAGVHVSVHRRKAAAV